MKCSIARLLAGAAVIAAILAAMALPALAAESPNANCLGQFASELNQVGEELGIGPGLGGDVISNVAQGFAGQAGGFASSDCGQR
jgi:hypothetical protein